MEQKADDPGDKPRRAIRRVPSEPVAIISTGIPLGVVALIDADAAELESNRADVVRRILVGHYAERIAVAT